MVDKEICNKRFNRNPSNGECECDKSCYVGEYLDYKKCKCRRRLVGKLVEECSENIDEKELHQNKMIHNSTSHDYEKICTSCTVYIRLFAKIVSISCAFIYFH